MFDYPKLRTPLIAMIWLALFAGLLKVPSLPDWLRMIMVILCIVFGVAGVMTLADWVTFRAGERLRELGTARTWAATSLAGALKGLTAAQTDAVLRQQAASIVIIPEEDSTLIMVRCLRRDIPWEIVEEFFVQSMESEPYLMAVRNTRHEEAIADLTALIIAKGWATRASGPYAARLTKPLSWVAARFWVDLEGDDVHT
jgi:hypothetical protein